MRPQIAYLHIRPFPLRKIPRLLVTNWKTLGEYEPPMAKGYRLRRTIRHTLRRQLVVEITELSIGKNGQLVKLEGPGTIGTQLRQRR